MKKTNLLLWICCFFLASCQEEFVEEAVKSPESADAVDAVWQFEQEALRKGIASGDVELASPGDSIVPVFTPASETRAYSQLDTRNWMSRIEGNRAFTDMNIPGTHDSGADVKGANNCQTYSITQQLEWGVRVLDMRCRHVNDAFFIHHDVFYQNKTFGSVMTEINDFLNKNPSETIIMLVKEEHSAAETTRSFDDTFDWYMENYSWSNKIWNSSRGGFPANLDAARGKIIPLCRFQSKKHLQISWQDNCTFDASINGSGTKVRVQDSYYVSSAHWMNWKWEQVCNLFDEAWKSGKNTLYINYLSGSSAGVFPWDCAHGLIGFWGMNYQFQLYCEGKNLCRRLGIVMQDFCEGDYHTRNIINSNGYEPVGNKLTIWGVGSQETAGEDGRAINAIDGNPNTWWHSQYTGNYSWDGWISIGIRRPNLDNLTSISITQRPNVITGRPQMFSVDVQHHDGSWIPLKMKKSKGDPSVTVMTLDAYREGEQKFYFYGSWPGTDYRVTFYQPVNNTRYTHVAEIKLFDANNPGDIDQSGDANKPIIKTVSSQETVNGNGRAENILDGDPSTWWHTQYTGNYSWNRSASVTIKYPTMNDFNAISITHRPNKWSMSGRPLKFSVELNDNGNWLKINIKPSWAFMQMLNPTQEGEQIFYFHNSFPATEYRVTFEDTLDGTPYTFVSEIKLFKQ